MTEEEQLHSRLRNTTEALYLAREDILANGVRVQAQRKVERLIEQQRALKTRLGLDTRRKVTWK